MRPKIFLTAFVFAAACAGWSSAALADALPPDACSEGTGGATCDNAGPNANESGICVVTTCHSPSPPDGGTDYACTLCELADGGSPDASDADAGKDAGGDAGGDAGPVQIGGPKGDPIPSTSSTDGKPASSSSCAMSAATKRDGSTAIAMLALGLGLAAWGRRKRG